MSYTLTFYTGIAFPSPIVHTHPPRQHRIAQRGIAWPSIAQFRKPAAQRSIAQHSIAWHGMAWHGIAQHSTAQHSTAQHSIAQQTYIHICMHSIAQHSIAQVRQPLALFFCLLREASLGFWRASEKCYLHICIFIYLYTCIFVCYFYGSAPMSIYFLFYICLHT